MPKSLTLWNQLPASTRKILVGSAIGLTFAAVVGYRYQKVVDIRAALGFGALFGAVITWVTDWDAEVERSVREEVQKSSPPVVPASSPFAVATQNMIAAIANQDPNSPEFHNLMSQSAIVMGSAAQAFNPVPPSSTVPVNVQEIFGKEEYEEEDAWGENVVSIQSQTRSG